MLVRVRSCYERILRTSSTAQAWTVSTIVISPSHVATGLSSPRHSYSTSAAAVCHVLPAHASTSPLHTPTIPKILPIRSSLKNDTSANNGCMEKLLVILASCRQAQESSRVDGDAVPHSHHPPTSSEVAQAALYLLRTSSFNRVVALINLAHRVGIQLRQSVFEGLVHELSKLHRWQLVPRIVTLGKKCTGRTTSRLLDWQLRAHIETSNFARLDQVDEEYTSNSVKMTRRTFHLLISGHLKNNNVEQARGCMARMSAQGIPIDGSTHAVIMAAYRGLGSDTAVVELAFKALNGIDGQSATRTLNNLLQSFLDADNHDDAQRIISMFHPAHRTARLTHLSGTPSCMATPKLGDTQLVASDIKPDSTTYTILLRHMAHHQDLKGASKVVEMAYSTGLDPDAGLMAALARVYFVTKHPSAALALVGHLCRDHVCYDVFVALGALDTPRHLPFRKWESVPPDIRILNELADGVIRIHGLNGFHAAIRIMKQCEIRPDARTLDILLLHVKSREHLRLRPRELTRVLRLLGHVGVRPTDQHYHTFLSGIVKEERLSIRPRGWRTAVSVDPSMHDTSPRPTAYRLSRSSGKLHPGGGFIFPSRRAYRQAMKPILHSLASHGIRADRATLALRIQHEAVVQGNLGSAKAVFANMVAAGIHPNQYHYCALMEGHAAQGDMIGANVIFDAVKAAGISPNLVMFTVMVAGYGRIGLADEAFHTFQDMLNRGIRPDHGVIDALCSAYFSTRQASIARDLLIRLWPYATDVPRPDLHDHGSPLTLSQLRHAFTATRSQAFGQTIQKRTLPANQSLLLRWKLRRIVDSWIGSCRRRRHSASAAKSPNTPAVHE